MAKRHQKKSVPSLSFSCGPIPQNASEQPTLEHAMRRYNLEGATFYTKPYAMEAFLRPSERDAVTNVTMPSEEDTIEERNWSIELEL